MTQAYLVVTIEGERKQMVKDADRS